eukprot:scpid69849/ scgid27570/ 
MLTNGEVHFNKTILDGTCPAGGPTTASSDDYKHGTVSNHIRRAKHSEALHTTELQSSGAVLFCVSQAPPCSYATFCFNSCQRKSFTKLISMSLRPASPATMLNSMAASL